MDVRLYRDCAVSHLYCTPSFLANRTQFEEFVVALKQQMKAGGTLAAAVTSVSANLGWLNPLSWFGGGDV